MKSKSRKISAADKELIDEHFKHLFTGEEFANVSNDQKLERVLK
jgi:hypothetical protein